ncbi:hypothetical protein GHK01_31750 [Sinorhizobium meliloti]|uniref:hypothetical protein n=1 Tax=Rhizobium meliloti TaxID=382 RepID=UPI0012964958|nr:hypothetical protein [Sinorhizobium meliloti]MQV31036.1 hypothetical protein [Sinorhizobium meliloti]
MPLEPEFDPDWDSPEEWRARGIRDVHERAKEFHRIKAELEVGISTARKALVRKPVMREDEIEAAAQRAYDALQERKAKDKG